jgi:hypothetical protein
MCQGIVSVPFHKGPTVVADLHEIVHTTVGSGDFGPTVFGTHNQVDFGGPVPFESTDHALTILF